MERRSFLKLIAVMATGATTGIKLPKSNVYNKYTLFETLKKQTINNGIKQIAKCLSEQNELLRDLPLVEA